jgi:NADH-quinone oxidoreductase subunit M
MTVSILIFLPVIAALAVLLFKNGSAKYAALTFSIAELAVALYFLSSFTADSSVQFAIDVPWIAKLGIYFNAGIDGISMIMVLLTTVLVPLIILTTFKHQYRNAPAFYALILFMQAGLLVVFTALDGFLLYLRTLGRRESHQSHHQIFHLYLCGISVYAVGYHLPVSAITLKNL